MKIKNRKPWRILELVFAQIIFVSLLVIADKKFLMTLIPLFEIDILGDIIIESTFKGNVSRRKKWWISLGISCVYLFLYYGYYVYIKGAFSTFGIVSHVVILEGATLFYVFLAIRNWKIGEKNE